MTDTAGSADASRPDRGTLIGRGAMWLAKWSLCLVAIAAGWWVIDYVLAKFWVVVLPVVLAIVVSTVLWPPTRALMKVGLKPAAATSITIVGFIVFLTAVIAVIVPSVVNQAPDLANRTTEGVNKVREWLRGPPLNVADEQMSSAVSAIVDKLQSSATRIASGVFTGVTTAGSMVVALFLVLVLTFFFLKDGRRFIPWMHSVIGTGAGRHVEAVLLRSWDTLGGFIRTQALVSFIDAFFIGLGLVILGVPLALVLAVLTFFGGFIPIIGAFVAGALAVLVALVANGLTTALIVLAIISAVQQLEGNLLQPMLQSRSMKLHAVVVLLAVTAGGSLYGIPGAFLAVPVAAVAAVLVRYLGEQLDAATAERSESTVGSAPSTPSTPRSEPAAESPPDRE